MYSMVTFSLDDMMKYQDCVPVVILHELHWTSLHTVHLCGVLWSFAQLITNRSLCLLPITVSSSEESGSSFAQLVTNGFLCLLPIAYYCLLQCPLQSNLVPVLSN